MIEITELHKWFAEFHVLQASTDRSETGTHRGLRPFRVREIHAHSLYQSSRGTPEGRIVVDGIELTNNIRTLKKSVRKWYGVSALQPLPHLTFWTTDPRPLWFERSQETG